MSSAPNAAAATLGPGGGVRAIRACRRQTAVDRGPSAVDGRRSSGSASRLGRRVESPRSTRRRRYHVGTLFGTDGVRGLANRDLTADLALDLAAAAAHVLGELGELHAGRPGARPRAVVGRDPRASGEFLEAATVAGLASAGLDVLGPRRPAHARRRPPDRRARRRPRRDDLGLAQPDARQRDQVLRPRRAQARRRGRGADRGPPRRRGGSARSVPTSGGSCTTTTPWATTSSTCSRARPTG